MCVCVPSLCAFRCKTIKKHFVYCGIEALIRFALVHFASVWFGFCFCFCFCFCSCFVFVRFGWVFGFGFIPAAPVILPVMLAAVVVEQSCIVYYSTGTTQLPPPFVIELIPARGSRCTSIISCHTVEIWLRFFHIQPRVYLIEIKSIFDCTTNNRDPFIAAIILAVKPIQL